MSCCQGCTKKLLSAFFLLILFFSINNTRASLPVAVNDENYIVQSMQNASHKKKSGWLCTPPSDWILNLSDNQFEITVNTESIKNRYSAVLDVSSAIEFSKRRDYWFGGWIKAVSEGYTRDAVAEIVLVGDYGYRELLREFRSDGLWTYFEKRLSIPANVGKLKIVLNARISPGAISFKSLFLVPAGGIKPVWKTDSQVRISDKDWKIPNRKYRLTGTVDSVSDGQPLWVDFDFARLILMAGSREPINPSSIVVLAIDKKGDTKKLVVSFDKPLSNLSDHYKRNGTLKWKTLQGSEYYQIYFNTSGKEGPQPLVLDKPLGIGELLNYSKNVRSPLWAGWPGSWLDIKDVDNDGDFDIYANNTDAGIWLLRNIGTNDSPLFLPRQKPVFSDKLVSINLPDKQLNWDNDGDLDCVVCKKHKRGTYVDGEWASMYIKFNEKAKPAKEADITDLKGRKIIFDNATWFAMESGDFNGDGYKDLVIGSADSDLQLLINRSEEKLISGVERKVIKFNTYLENFYDSGDMSLKPFVLDWNKDGRDDIVLTGWNGFCYLMTNKNCPGKAEFNKPIQLKQLSGNLNVADSATPEAVDWDGDGDIDILCGDVNGHITFFENIGSKYAPKLIYGGWLRNDLDEPIRITASQFGGTIQGAVERWWGYLSCQAADVDKDGDIDLIVNDSLGRLRWIENIGSRRQPILSHLIRPFLYKSMPLITPWRNRPGVADWNGDGIIEITVLNDKGELVRYSIDSEHPDYLQGGEVLKGQDGKPILIYNPKTAARSSGRSQIDTGDWDNDGDIDILIGRPRRSLGHGNLLFIENVGSVAEPVFKKDILRARGLRFVEWTGSDGHDQWHSGGPCMVDWDNDGQMDIIHGTESGRLAFYNHDYFVGKSFPVFNPQTFEISDGKVGKIVFDFSKDRSLWTESLVPEDTPIQWLKSEKKCKLDISNRRVEIISPLKNQKISGQVVFEAKAFGIGIDRIDFYIDGQWVAKETVAPFVAFGDNNRWETNTVNNGKHSLTVKVTYLDGNVLTASHEVFVKN